MIIIVNQNEWRNYVSSISDLTAAVTSLNTELSNFTVDVTALITAVQNALSNEGTVLDPADQAALNSAVTALQGDVTSTQAEETTVTSETSSV